MTSTWRPIALLSSTLVAFLLATQSGCDPGALPGESAADPFSAVNLCVGQAANTFHCLDDSAYQQCTGNGTFVVNSCPGNCATRHPASKNPCVGADRATEIDGVPPTPAGQLDDAPPGNNGGGNNGGVCTKNLCVGQAANTFHCTDDTSFQLCTGNDQFTVGVCPKGFCATRNPAVKNPCIGALRAQQIDGVPPTPACQ